MRYFATYLIYLAVLARAAGWSQDSPPLRLITWALLGLFGAVLALEPWLTRRWAGFPRLYALAQSSLVIAMLFLDPGLDFLSMLFLPLSFQMVQFFGPRAGGAWIGVFSLAMTGQLFLGLEWKPGIPMLLLATGINALMGRFALLIDRTGRARQANQRLFAELQEAHHTLKDSAAQAQALAVAEERHRLVRQLHDTLTQTLFSMNLAVQAAQLSLDAQLSQEQDPSQTGQHIRRLQSLSRRAAGEVKTLTSPALDPSGLAGDLPAALRELAAVRQFQDGLQITLEIVAAGEPGRFSKIVTADLYHLTQEALTNIAKHAHTLQAAIRLDLAGHPACLQIEDPGCGFDLPDPRRPASPNRQPGFGLGDMAERAREIGWEFELDSAPGRGTRICVREKMP